MVQDYQDVTIIDVDAEAEQEVDFPKAPPKLPPSLRWKPRTCRSRHMILILLGLSAVLLIAITVFGVKGSNSSSQLWGMTGALESINQTFVAEMVALQGKGRDTDAKLAGMGVAVKRLNQEAEAAQARLLTQLATWRRSLRLLKCDLENFQQNRTENPETCCPHGWAQFRKNCYWDSSEGRSWEDAKADCEDREAHLLIVNSYEEQLFVATRVRPRYVWIGLTDASGSWKWVDGTPYTVRPEDWMPEQPDDWYGHGLGGGEDCAHLHRDGRWNDDHCSRHYGWVCEMEGKE